MAWTRARFIDGDPAGNRIPDAVDRVGSLGISWQLPRGWSLGGRLRHLGPAALTEDNAVRSAPSTLVNFDLGYRFGRGWKASLALLNAFDAKANDITYFYESRLPGETSAVPDVHFHPVEPRQWRVSVAATF